MSLITRMRKQKAVYWPFIQAGAQGRAVLGPPVVIDCRWETVNTTFIDFTGETRISRCVVYVDREVTLRGFMWKYTGASTDSDAVILNAAPQSPMEHRDATEIRFRGEMPNLRNTETLRTVML